MPITQRRGEPEGAARETSATERLAAVKGHVAGLKGFHGGFPSHHRFQKSKMV